MIDPQTQQYIIQAALFLSAIALVCALIEIRQLGKQVSKKPDSPKAEPTRENEAGVGTVAQKVSAKEQVDLPQEPQPPATTLEGGLKKTRNQLFSKLAGLLAHKPEVGSDLTASLEELLITSDLGVSTTKKLLTALQEDVQELSEITEQGVRDSLRGSITEILKSEIPAKLSHDKVEGQPRVILFVGVNGVGKTTTIGKLAKQFNDSGAKVVLGACDTFRAAAVEQLQIWGERVGVEVVSGQEGAKPSTVAYESVHRAKELGADVLILDTAGRLHTRVNLMNELQSIISIIDREQPGAPHETILVLDATTGQNAFQQAREFDAKSKLSGIVITKLDGTPKGGVVVGIKDEIGIPIRYIGVGEGVSDLREFNAVEFVDALFVDDVEPVVIEQSTKPRQRVARRRRRDTQDVSNGA